MSLDDALDLVLDEAERVEELPLDLLLEDDLPEDFELRRDEEPVEERVVLGIDPPEVLLTIDK